MATQQAVGGEEDIKELALRVSNFTGEDGRSLGPLYKLFDNLPVPTSLDEAMVPVITVHGTSIPFARIIELAKSVGVDRTTFDGVKFVSAVEAAALLLYSADSEFYPLLNATLRNQDRQQLKPFVKIIWLLMHALSKCPLPLKRHVYRGINMDISASYPRDRVVTWNAFSSCTTNLNTLENDVFMGTFGPRTMFSIELTTNRGRVIAACSFHANEEEVLLPPNTRFQVESTFRSGDGLVIVHMKELPSLDPILDFPGTVLNEDALISLQSELASARSLLREKEVQYETDFLRLRESESAQRIALQRQVEVLTAENVQVKVENGQVKAENGQLKERMCSMELETIRLEENENEQQLNETVVVAERPVVIELGATAAVPVRTLSAELLRRCFIDCRVSDSEHITFDPTRLCVTRPTSDDWHHWISGCPLPQDRDSWWTITTMGCPLIGLIGEKDGVPANSHAHGSCYGWWDSVWRAGKSEDSYWCGWKKGDTADFRYSPHRRQLSMYHHRSNKVLTMEVPLPQVFLHVYMGNIYEVLFSACGGNDAISNS